MDRNNLVGFSLLGILVVVYFVYNSHEQKAYMQQKFTDSVANAKMHPKPIADTAKTVAVQQNTAVADAINDSLRKTLPPAYSGTDQTIKVESKKLALRFTTKGAFPVSAELKGYKTYYQQPLYLFNGKGNELNVILPINNGAVATSDLYFTPTVKDNPNGDKIVDFSADLGAGKKVDIIYTLPDDNYMVHCDIHLTGMPANNLAINWNTNAQHTEKDILNERMASQVYYRYKSGDDDYFTIRDDKTKSLSDGEAQWVGFRKQYFSTVLVSNDGTLTDVKVNSTADSTKLKDSNIVASTVVSMNVPLKAGNDEAVSLNWYIGPNDYKTLKAYNMGFDNMVPMGYGIMAFVKYINRYALVPIFYFLGSFISNYAIIIILMTIFIRLVLSFFTYKSYLSAAKMRVMKPEIDALRAKFPDQQKFSMEQMKLYRSVGINQLGGCLPTLFQMPFLVSMYYMFPSFIEFRQQHFLWAKDLSTYDSIAHLPFNIPFYGDHISLFTLLMTASSMFLALYNRNNMAAQDPNNNQMMKYMPFVMPIIFMGIFNKMAAALTFYYTFSNLISITQQFIIQKYFIDEKAIHAQLQANKNKPTAPSKWAQKLEEIQKTQAERAKVAPRSVKK